MPTSDATKILQLISILSFAFVTSATPVASPSASTTTAPPAASSTTFNQGSDYGGGSNPDDGSVGTDNGSFNLSKGGIIAIAVVVSVVVVLGIASTVLFFIAKKRQWQVRKSIGRASRRVTSKMTGRPTREDQARRTRRHGAVRLEGERSKRDVEKGARRGADQKAMEMTKTKKVVPVMPPS